MRCVTGMFETQCGASRGKPHSSLTIGRSQLPRYQGATLAAMHAGFGHRSAVASEFLTPLGCSLSLNGVRKHPRFCRKPGSRSMGFLPRGHRLRLEYSTEDLREDVSDWRFPIHVGVAGGGCARGRQADDAQGVRLRSAKQRWAEAPTRGNTRRLGNRPGRCCVRRRRLFLLAAVRSHCSDVSAPMRPLSIGCYDISIPVPACSTTGTGMPLDTVLLWETWARYGRGSEEVASSATALRWPSGAVVPPSLPSAHCWRSAGTDLPLYLGKADSNVKP